MCVRLHSSEVLSSRVAKSAIPASSRLLSPSPVGLRSIPPSASLARSFSPRKRTNSAAAVGVSRRFLPNSEMGFWVTTLIFALAGVVASLTTRLCCNRGPSVNLLYLTLIITATVCCWMMWAIVYLAQLNPLIVPILNEGE